MYNSASDASASADGRCHFSYGPIPPSSDHPHPSNVNSPPQNKRSIPGWFKLLILVSGIGVIFGVFGLLLKENIADIVEEQLKKIQENRITQAYYEYTSKEFQSSTSLEAFREFITLYPVLAQHKTFILEKKSILDNEGIVQGILVSENLNEMEVDYRLVKEGNSWKVQTIRLKESTRDDSPDSASSALVKKVEGQLKALREKDFNEAYYGFVSKEFQKETPLETFQQFVQSHPVLYQYAGVEYKGRKILNDQGFVDLILNSNQGDFFLEYTFVRENGDWRIWGLKLTLSPEEAEKEAATNPKAMEGPIRDFLDKLHLGEVEQAYTSTAKEFQETTPVEAFKGFVSQYPVLKERDLVDIKGGQIENGVGKMRVNLHNEIGMTILEFRLGFENGEWKIWGVQILEQPRVEGTVEQKSVKGPQKKDFAKQLQAVVEKHLEDLRYQNISSAYAAMSEGYRIRNSLQDFDAYILRHPAFGLNRYSHFHRIGMDKKKISLRGEITSFDYENYPVKYDLVKENGNWKVDNFVVVKENELIAQNENEFPLNNPIRGSVESPMQFAKIDISSSDAEGRILPPSDTIDKNAAFIYINVDVQEGKQGTVVKLILEHVDTASTAPYISTSLENDGDVMVAFSYAAPKQGWPTGQYIVKVTAATGAEAVKKFTIQ